MSRFLNRAKRHDTAAFMVLRRLSTETTLNDLVRVLNHEERLVTKKVRDFDMLKWFGRKNIPRLLMYLKSRGLILVHGEPGVSVSRNKLRPDTRISITERGSAFVANPGSEIRQFVSDFGPDVLEELAMV